MEWAKAPEVRDQMVLFPHRLDDVISLDHHVRLMDDILSRLDWSKWEAAYDLRSTIYDLRSTTRAATDSAAGHCQHHSLWKPYADSQQSQAGRGVAGAARLSLARRRPFD